MNDNHGRRREDFEEFAEEIIKSNKPGGRIAKLLKPAKEHYHIIKPQRSGFYATPLGALLISENISNLIITGFTTDICVLLTALDAQMRGYHVHVPPDCTAAVKPEYHKDALRFLARVAEADTRPCGEINLEKLVGQSGTSPAKSVKPPKETETITVSTHSNKSLGSVFRNTDGLRQSPVNSY